VKSFSVAEENETKRRRSREKKQQEATRRKMHIIALDSKQVRIKEIKKKI
jgi:hypothetical protein